MQSRTLMFLVLVMILTWIGTATECHAGFSLGIVGSGSIARPTGGGTRYTASDLSMGNLGGGLIFGFGLGSKASLEFNALFTRRKYSSDTTVLGVSTTTTNQVTFYEFPVLLRYWFMRWVSIGLGGYYALQKGSVPVEVTSNGSTTSANGSWVANKTDYGVVGSLALAIGGGTIAGYLDGRYYYGLASINKVGAAVNWQEMQGLVGILLRF